MERGICPKCHKEKRLTRHHYKPKRFFRRSNTIRLCRPCHNELETLIPIGRKMPVRFYYWVVKIFLEEGGTDNGMSKMRFRQFFTARLDFR